MLEPMSRWEPDAAGRLMKAAIALFDEQGYDATTVAEIAERAGLTKRTFFRHFADKREALFHGWDEVGGVWLAALEAAPPAAHPLSAVAAGFEPVGAMFVSRHPFARMRWSIVTANPELRERELIKLHALAESLAGALRSRGVPENAAMFAAQAATIVFHVAFDRWVRQDDPAALRSLLDESLAELRSVTAVASAE